MVTLQHMLNFPSLLASRQDSWKSLRPDIVSIKRNEKNKTILVTGKTKTYTQHIEINDVKTTLASPVTVSCTCDSFKFEFAYVLHKLEGLYQPGIFSETLQSAPKIKNKFGKPSGCKHIIAFSRLLTKRITTLRI